MKVGDLVRWKNSHACKGEAGVILEMRGTREDYPDYRMKDAVLVLWHDSHEWVWISEVVKNEEERKVVINENR